MDDNLMRFLGWIVAVLMIVLAAGTFLVRYAGFTNMVNHVEQVSLSDSVVWREDEAQVLSAETSEDQEGQSAGKTRLLRAFRGGLVSICNGGELKGVIMMAGTDGAWDEPITVDGQPISQVEPVSIPDDARYRVSYALTSEGRVTGTAYDLIP